MSRPRILQSLLPVCLLALTTCGGGSSGGDTTAAPLSLAYAVSPGLYRVNEAIAPNAATTTGGTPTGFTVAPALPAGLSLDPTTGAITGTPTNETPGTTYTVTASNSGGSAQAALDITIGAELPAAFLSLREGFVAEVVTESAVKVAKIASADDGRIFLIEVDTGRIRVIDPQLGLLAQPYLDLSQITVDATLLDLLGGSHRGLLGLALHPNFGTTDPYIYVIGCWGTADTGTHRQVLLRFTDDAQNNVGTDQQVVLDDLPMNVAGGINNGGELLFGDAQGTTLFVSLGDAGVPANSQAAAGTSLAGKILRIQPTIPATVPAANASGTFEWCRGLRNTFGLALHPTLGQLYGVDNGPAQDDELNYLTEGKNFEWGAMGQLPPGDVGLVMETWQTVIVPTAIAWHLGAEFVTANPLNHSLLLTSYDDQKIRQMLIWEGLGGFADVTSASDFAEFRLSGNDNKPLDIEVDTATGDILVSTFIGVYRIRKM